MQEQVENESAAPLGQKLRQHPAYPVLYMFAVTFVFVVVLVGLSRATRERVEANRRVLRERAILMAALPDEVDARMASPEVSRVFRERVEEPDVPGAPYRVLKDGELHAYSLPVEGQGFWDAIRGALGIAPDGERVLGIAFHEQNETPGLGGEILSAAFRNQFRGKKLAPGDEPLRMVSPAETPDEHSVHAITGATQTSVRLERIIREDVNAWRHLKEP